jgi:hypothetical protein
MPPRGTPVSRDALYEKVWTDSMTVVTPRCGLSDVDQHKARYPGAAPVLSG